MEFEPRKSSQAGWTPEQVGAYKHVIDRAIIYLNRNVHEISFEIGFNEGEHDVLGVQVIGPDMVFAYDAGPAFGYRKPAITVDLPSGMVEVTDRENPKNYGIGTIQDLFRPGNQASDDTQRFFQSLLQAGQKRLAQVPEYREYAQVIADLMRYPGKTKPLTMLPSEPSWNDMLVRLSRNIINPYGTQNRTYHPTGDRSNGWGVYRRKETGDGDITLFLSEGLTTFEIHAEGSEYKVLTLPNISDLWTVHVDRDWDPLLVRSFAGRARPSRLRIPTALTTSDGEKALRIAEIPRKIFYLLEERYKTRYTPLGALIHEMPQVTRRLAAPEVIVDPAYR